MEEMRSAYVVSRKPGVKRPRGMSTHRWEDNIRMNLGDIGWGGVNWMHLAHDGEQ